MRENDLQKLKKQLEIIKSLGWIENQRHGNAGGVGNTLEDLLDVAENNLQIPDFGEWELKSQRSYTTSLLTLFHSEPKPRKARIVPQILLPKYGWPHQEAGTTYPSTERSFRQTINATSFSDRGFKVRVDRRSEKITIDFDFSQIHDRHAKWKSDILNGVGTGNLDPAPYWDFSDIEQKLKSKLNNLMFVSADTRRVGDKEYFKYNDIEVYMDPTLDRFLALLDAEHIYVGFDARTGHNHGTKFRIKSDQKVNLYQIHIDA